MKQTKMKNTGHSIFQRLLNYAKTRGDDFNLLLVRYGIERLMYRLGLSSHSDKFILKGATLFLVWKGQSYRVTKDADFLAYGSADAERISEIFRELCRITYEEDGIVFKEETVKTANIREEQEYDGIRVTLVGMLHQASIPLQIDIGFGDVVTPMPKEITFPTILDVPAPRLRAYSRETMIAEKLETMIRLGMANSRMKDFYDIWLLSRLFDFNGAILLEAIQKTFSKRKTILPSRPVVFQDSFYENLQKTIQWQAFIRKADPDDVPESLKEIMYEIKAFLEPIIAALIDHKTFQKTWKASGTWK